jgi:hypothetical protein
MGDALRPVAKRLGITHEAAIGAALTLMRTRGAPASTVTPAIRAAVLPVIAPAIRANASTGKQYTQPVEQLRRSQLRPVQPAVTRQTLCRHLGLSEKTSSYEIRRHAKNTLSGSRSMGSSIERAAALTAHLGLPRGSTAARVLAIVWTLTAPATAPNPYLKRLAGK